MTTEQSPPTSEHRDYRRWLRLLKDLFRLAFSAAILLAVIRSIGAAGSDSQRKIIALLALILMSQRLDLLKIGLRIDLIEASVSRPYGENEVSKRRTKDGIGILAIMDGAVIIVSYILCLAIILLVN